MVQHGKVNRGLKSLTEGFILHERRWDIFYRPLFMLQEESGPQLHLPTYFLAYEVKENRIIFGVAANQWIMLLIDSLC